MLAHLVNLLAHALVEFPTVISGNWLSILLPAALYLLIEFPKLRKGWGSMKPESKHAFWRDSKILIAAYVTLFAWSVVRTVYQDHVYLTARIAADAQQASGAIWALNAEYQKLQIHCARTQGANDTLTNQNRDQQNTINNCQTEAIRRLVPEMENHGSFEVLGVGNEHLKAYIYTTNRTIPPTAIVVRCDRDIADLDAFIMGNPARFYPRYKVTGVHRYTFQTPANWTPNAPIQINISFTGDAPDCTLQRTDK